MNLAPDTRRNRRMRRRFGVWRYAARMESGTTLATIERIESASCTILRVRVVLDSDLAARYGVEVRVPPMDLIASHELAP